MNLLVTQSQRVHTGRLFLEDMVLKHEDNLARLTESPTISKSLVITYIAMVTLYILQIYITYITNI